MDKSYVYPYLFITNNPLGYAGMLKVPEDLNPKNRGYNIMSECGAPMSISQTNGPDPANPISGERL